MSVGRYILYERGVEVKALIDDAFKMGCERT
jgi:hypothetical protein